MKFLTALFIPFVVVAVGCGGAGDTINSAPEAKDSQKPVTVAAAKVHPGVSENVSSNSTQMPKVIDFGSKKCVACKAMEPVLESLMKNHADKFTTEFVDVWIPANQMYARSFNVSSIPTQVFIGADGKELFRHIGFISEEQILAKWQELGVTFAASEVKASEPVESAEPMPEQTESAVEEKTE